MLRNIKWFAKIRCIAALGLHSRTLTNRPISKPILYGDEASPPVRFVMITAALLGVDYHFHNIDLFKGENKSEFYKKINPLQKVPALAVNNEIISDSHAIALYLCRSVEDQDLYPADNVLRAKVDQMLYFNATVLFAIDSAILSSYCIRDVKELDLPQVLNINTDYFAGRWPVDETITSRWYAALDYLESELGKHEWLVGDKMQLCDVCCAMTLSSLGILFPPLERHVLLKAWMERMDSMQCFTINRQGMERLQFFVDKYSPTCA